MESMPRIGQPASAYTPGSGFTRLGSQEIAVQNADAAREAIDELVSHREMEKGRLIGLAGGASHGKTDFALRLLKRFQMRNQKEQPWTKTPSNVVHRVELPGPKYHDILVDLAGENFDDLAQDDRALPVVLEQFLWPLLRDLDGLLFFIALPMEWQAWNLASGPDGQYVRAPVTEALRRATQDRAISRMESFKTLLKYVAVAKQFDRLVDEFTLDRAIAPQREIVDQAFRRAGAVDIPIVVLFSKADIFCTPRRLEGLFAPPFRLGGPGTKLVETPPIDPRRCDPRALAWAHYRDLSEFMEAHVRTFTFDFVQARSDDADDPDPIGRAKADERGQYDDSPAIGAMSALEFVTAHRWDRWPWLSTGAAVKKLRARDREQWTTAEGLCAALSGDAAADASPTNTP